MSSEKNTNVSLEIMDCLAIPSFEQGRLTHLEEIMGPEMASLLTQQFITQAPLQIQALQDLLREADAENVRRKAHQFKGENLQIGATRLGHLCEKIELLAQQSELEAIAAQLPQLETELAQVIEILTQVGNYD